MYKKVFAAAEIQHLSQLRRNHLRNTRNRGGGARILGTPLFGAPKYCEFNLRQYINSIINSFFVVFFSIYQKHRLLTKYFFFGEQLQFRDKLNQVGSGLE